MMRSTNSQFSILNSQLKNIKLAGGMLSFQYFYITFVE